jgi:hypothetical protein
VSVPDQNQNSGFAYGVGGWRRRPTNRVVVLLFNVFLAGLGVFFIVSGYNLRAAVRPIVGGKTTIGTVVSVLNGENCGRYGCSPDWTPTIRFETPDGAAYTFAGPTYSSQISAGQTVNVSYLPANPAVAHDISASSGQGVLLIGFGAFAAVIGLGSSVLGFEALHRRTGLSSARPGGGWVGHRHIHSNQGTVVVLAVFVALVAVGIFVI